MITLKEAVGKCSQLAEVLEAFGWGETVGWGLCFWLGVKLLARKCCHVEKNVNFVKIGK